MKPAKNLASGVGTAIKAISAIAVLAVALFVGQAAFSTLAHAFGFHPQENARAWASLTPRYADSAACAGCHGAEYLSTGTGSHKAIACDSCHGPQAEHASESAPAVDLASDELCVRCHEAIAGRPQAFPQQDLADHFGSAPCAQCHDPHSAQAVSPPPVSHPLDKLPDCTVCHGTTGMRPAPAGHALDSSDACLRCHSVARTS